MRETLETKANNADLLVLESRVDECCPTSRVDILEEDIATRAPREYVQAVETAMKKKADRTELQVSDLVCVNLSVSLLLHFFHMFSTYFPNNPRTLEPSNRL